MIIISTVFLIIALLAIPLSAGINLANKPMEAMAYSLRPVMKYCSTNAVNSGPVLSEVAKLTASNGDENDQFGISMSMSGDTLVVGAFGWDKHGGVASGWAYVFERNVGGSENWGEVKKLVASDGVKGDWFGHSVCVSGNTIIVGACFPFNGSKGAAYVFERNFGGANNWGEAKKLTASDGAENDYFGYVVGISGDTIVVSASGNDESGVNSGAAYVFERNTGGAGNWGEVKKLMAPVGIEYDAFGDAVSISNDTIVVGVLNSDNHKGSAYVFERNIGGAENWGEVKKLTASDGAENDNFGHSLSIDVNSIVVSAFCKDSSKGAAYVFERNLGGENNWGEVKKLTASDGAENDYFGGAVGVSGDTVVIGAHANDDKGTDSGSAYVFKRNQGGENNWGEVKKLTASDGAENDFFGYAVDISGDTIAVSALMDDDKGSDSGSAYLFQWVPEASFNILTGSLPEGDVGTLYWQNIKAMNGALPYTWAIKEGAKLPPGLVFQVYLRDTSKLSIYGKPTKIGDFPFTVRVKDNAEGSFEKEFVLHINHAVTLLAPALPKGEVGAAFPFWKPSAAGGNGSYTWSISRGVLPEGLNLDTPTGAIIGIPTASGTFRITLTVKDGLTPAGSNNKILSLTILKPLTIITPSLPNGDPNVTYKTTTLKTTGGASAKIWSIKEGVLPSGLDFSFKGVIKGKPAGNSSGTYNLTIQVSDGLGLAVQDYSLTIYEPMVISGLPDGVAGVPYSHVLTATGGSGGYKFAKTGSWPKWLKLDTKTSTLFGTPPASGIYSFNIKVTDSLRSSVIQTMTLMVE